MRFSLRHIEIFVAITRHGSISAAAKELAMSQSAASTALIELERRYDRPLFDRVGKRLIINEAGRAMLPASLEFLDRASEIDAVLTGGAGLGPLRIGSTQTIGNYVTPHLIHAYLRRKPTAAPSLEIANTQEIADKLLDFQIDVALVEGDVSHPDLSVTKWLEDELIIVCAAQHRLAQTPHCTAADLVGEGWVVREPGSGTRQTFDSGMRRAASTCNIVMELQNPEAILETVSGGPLLGCASKLAANRHLVQGSLVQLHIPEVSLKREFHIVLNRKKYMSPSIRKFVEICEMAVEHDLLDRLINRAFPLQ